MIELMNLITDWQATHAPQANQALIKKIKKEEKYLQFLEDNYNFVDTLEKKIWHFKNNVETISVCEYCGGEVKQFSFSKGYNKTCSKSCATYSMHESGKMIGVGEKISKTQKTLYSKKGEKYNEIKEKREKTCLERYGSKTVMENKNIVEKLKQNNLKNFGVDNCAKTKESKEKTSKKWKELSDDKKQTIISKRIKTNKKTLNTKYGNDINSVFQIPEIKERLKNNNIRKRGFEYNFQSPEVRQKCKNTMIKRYGKDNPMKVLHFIEKSFKNSVKLKKHIFPSGISKKVQGYLVNAIPILLEKYNESDIVYENSCPKFYYNENKNLYTPDAYIQKDNLIIEVKSVYTLLRELSKNIKKFQSVIDNGYNLDLYLFNDQKEKYNFVFKFRKELKSKFTDLILENSLIKENIFFKSEGCLYFPEKNIIFKIIPETSNKKNELKRIKHQFSTKSNSAIEVVFIFEDLIRNKPEIILSRILNKLGYCKKIYARKCQIKEISYKEVSNFLNSNHIQGSSKSSKNLGLFYENKLVSVMTFGKKRISLGNKIKNENDYELYRFANLLDFSIVGGASKLLKYFIKNYNPNSITTFADKNWSNGNLYETLGFKKISETESNYWYIKDGIRKHRYVFIKSNLVKQGYNSELTEFQIMDSLNYNRVYDCGSIKYELKFN